MLKALIPYFKKIKLNAQLFIIFSTISLSVFIISVSLSVFYIDNYSNILRHNTIEDVETTLVKSTIIELNRLRSLVITHSFSTDLLDASEIHDYDWININTNHYLYDNPTQKLVGSALINNSSNFQEIKGTLPFEFYDNIAKKLSAEALVAGASNFLVSHGKHLYLVSFAGLTDVDHDNLRGYLALVIELDTQFSLKIYENFNNKATVALSIVGASQNLVTPINDDHLASQLMQHVRVHLLSLVLVDSIRDHANKLFILIIGLYSVASVLILIFLSRLTVNFEHTIDSIKNITYSDYSQKLDLGYSKDFFELGECINNLSGELSARDAAISQKYLEIISILVKTLEEVDIYTRGHSERVSHYSVEIAKAISYPDLESIRLSGLLHDIGKITVDTKILNKPSKLSPEEFKEIQKHPLTAYSILDMSETFLKIKEIVRSHHEKMDGSGYPYQLKGDQIPIGARIVAIADVFDSLTSERSYRKPMPLQEALEIILQDSGTHFDSELVAVFLTIAEEIYTKWSQLGSSPTLDELHTKPPHMTTGV